MMTGYKRITKVERAYGWPKGEQPGPACPNAEAGDTVRLRDTHGCQVRTLWEGMCPCAAVLAGWDIEWTGYDDDGNALPRHGESK